MAGREPRNLRLTAQDVLDAWAEYDRGVLTEELAERYGVTRKTLWRRFREAGLGVRKGGPRHCRRPAEPGGRLGAGGAYGLLMEYYRR